MTDINILIVLLFISNTEAAIMPQHKKELTVSLAIIVTPTQASY